MYFWIPHKLCIERCIWPLLLGFVVVVGVSEMVRSNFHTVDPFHTNLRTYTQARIWLVRTWFIPRCYRRHSNPSDSCPDRWLKYCTQALSFPPLPRQHGIFHRNCLTHTNCGKTPHRRRRMLPGPPKSDTTTPSLLWERSRGDKVLSFIQQPSGLRYHPRWSSHQ